MCNSLFLGLLALCLCYHRLGWNKENLVADGHLISVPTVQSENGKFPVLQSCTQWNLMSTDRLPLEITNISLLHSL